MKRIAVFLFLFLSATGGVVAAPCALIAGGSHGIGYAIAEALARRGWDLLLVARGQPALDKAQADLQSRYKVHVWTMSQDLTSDTAAARLVRFCAAERLPIRFLANVAGLGGERDFGQLPPDTLRYMIRLNLESPVLLTQAMLPMLKANQPSYILNVASMAGMAPIPYKNLYAATKSGVIFFSQGLRVQLKGSGVSVSCLAPGPVYTKPSVVETTRKALGKRIGDWMALSPEVCGEVAVKRTLKGRMMIVPGTVANLSSHVIRTLPPCWAAALYGKGKEYKKGKY